MNDTSNDFLRDISDGYVNFGFDVVDRAAVSQRNRLALVCAGGRSRSATMTYWELSVASNRVANVLRRRGVRARDVVMVLMPMTPRWCAAFLGIVKRGAVVLVTDPGASWADLVRLTSDVHVAAVIADHSGAAEFDRAGAIDAVRLVVDGPLEGWEDLDAACADTSGVLLHVGLDELTHASDPMLLVPYAEPGGGRRIAVHTHAYVHAMREYAVDWHGIGANDIHWALVPEQWTQWAWIALPVAWTVGATTVLSSPGPVVDPVDTLRSLSELGVTSFATTPALYRALSGGPMKAFELASLRSCVAAGAVDDDVLEMWRDGIEGVGIRAGIGAPDTGLLARIAPGMPPRPGVFGDAVGGRELVVVDALGGSVAAGVSGRLAVRAFPDRPNGLALAYLGDGSETDAGETDWHSTGIMTIADECGTLLEVPDVSAPTPVVTTIAMPAQRP